MDDTNFTAPPPAAPTPDNAGMRKLNDRPTKTFMTLVDGLSVGDARKLDNARGAFMAVSVDFLVGEELGTPSGPPWALYAVAHNYLANGDLIPDPTSSSTSSTIPTGQPRRRSTRSRSTTGRSATTATPTS